MNGFTLLRSNVSFPRFPDFYYGNALKLRMMSLRGKWIASNEALCQKFSLGLQIQQVNPKFLKPHLSKLLQHLVAAFYNPPVYLCVPVLTYHKEPTGLYAPVFSPAHGYINCLKIAAQENFSVPRLEVLFISARNRKSIEC